MKLILRRYKSSVQLSDVLTRRCQEWSFQILLGRCSLSMVTFLAAAVITGCGGVSTSTKTVTGTGPGASTHTVDLSWAASKSADVTGYNVYRAGYSSACGPLSKINTALTAVDTSNRESVYSNIVTDVQIPAS